MRPSAKLSLPPQATSPPTPLPAGIFIAPKTAAHVCLRLDTSTWRRPQWRSGQEQRASAKAFEHFKDLFRVPSASLHPLCVWGSRKRRTMEAPRSFRGWKIRVSKTWATWRARTACPSLRVRGGWDRVVHYACCCAISPTTMTAGGSHGQNSEDAAEQTALQNCRRNRATDCKILTWAERTACIGLAESYADKAYGFYVGDSRDVSAAGALARCQSGHGTSCVTVTATVGGPSDDIRWSAPLPLPPGGSTATVDPNMVGTWELFINPGRWVWRVAPNGTYVRIATARPWTIRRRMRGRFQRATGATGCTRSR